MGKENDHATRINRTYIKITHSVCAGKKHTINNTGLIKAAVIILLLGSYVSIIPSQSIAVSLFSFRNMRDYASGGITYFPGLVSHEISIKSRKGFIVQAGELGLFEIPGLKVSSLSFDIRGKLFSLSLLFSFLSSPVGSEKIWSLRMGYEDRKGTYVAADMNLYFQELDATQREVLLSCSLRMFFSISSNLGAGYSLGDLALMGEKIPGVDISTFIGFFTSSGSFVLPFLGFDRWGERGLGFASCIHLSRKSLKLINSFNSNTEELRGALGIDIGSVGLTIGAAIHPVLGTSKGLSLAWGF